MTSIAKQLNDIEAEIAAAEAESPRTKRRKLILSLIAKKPIGSQAKLAEALQGYGIEATHATLSRDLKALRVAKVANAEGAWRYQLVSNSTLVEHVDLSEQPSQTGFQLNSHSHQALLDRVEALEAHFGGLLDRIQALEEAVFGRSMP